MELVLDLNRRYTYADYLTWMDDKLRELFNGFVKIMSPAPSRKHQKTGGELFGNLRDVVKRNNKKNQKDNQIFYAPFDVRLPKDGETADDKIYTVVQPDICVVCDPAKLDDRGCLGAPDLIVEIQSPATAKYDLNDKFFIYEEAGVKEYWIVFPLDKEIVVFLLQENGKYDKGTIYQQGKVPVRIFDGEKIDINEIFT